jgi:hypothetical protein
MKNAVGIVRYIATHICSTTIQRSLLLYNRLSTSWASNQWHPSSTDINSVVWKVDAHVVC